MSGSDDDGSDLRARIAAIEKAVAALDERLAALARQSGNGAAPMSPPGAELAQPARPVAGTAPTDPGQWLNRLGIALLLFGVAFGLKYTIDQGWLGPAVRVVLGLGLGFVLERIGARLRDTRPGLSRLLRGGGVVSAYLSLYAAFQLYALISHGTAFAAMVLVSARAFALALRDDDAAMALLGTGGGLATPFLLATPQGSLSALVVYCCLVVATASAIFLRKGWRVLLWAAAVGGWLVVGTAARRSAHDWGIEPLVVQCGILFLAAATWGLAVVRETLGSADIDRWPPARFGLGSETTTPDADGVWTLQAHQLTLATPVLVLVASAGLWELGDTATGLLALALAGVWGRIGLALNGAPRAPTRNNDDAATLAPTHAIAAAVMLAFSLGLVLGDDARLVGLAAEATALHILARRSGAAPATLVAHALFALVATAVFERLLDGIGHRAPVVGLSEVADLAVIVAVAAAARIQSEAASGREAYTVAAQVGLLMWLLRDLGPLPNGAAWVTAAWFTNAVALTLVGLLRDEAALRRAGAAVMALTVTKLFVVDMASVDAGWRIVSFLAFGSVLLGLGYAFPTLWRRKQV